MDRFLRALQLEDRVYEEVASDPRSLAQSILLMAISSLAAGVGGSGGIVENMLPAASTFLTAWMSSVVVIYLVGTKVFPGRVRHNRFLPLLRTTGFATSPGIVRFLGFPPATSAIVAVGATLWLFGAMVFAVRYTFQCKSFSHALRVCIPGWIVYLAVTMMR